MDARTPNPDRATPARELSEPLRRAVEEIKADPVPRAAMDRAVARARRQRPVPLYPRRWLRRDLVAAACITAVFAAGLALSGRPADEARPDQVAEADDIPPMDWLAEAPSPDADNDVNWTNGDTGWRTVRYSVRTETGWRVVERRVPYTVCKTVVDPVRKKIQEASRFQPPSEVRLNEDLQRVLSPDADLKTTGETKDIGGIARLGQGGWAWKEGIAVNGQLPGLMNPSTATHLSPEQAERLYLREPELAAATRQLIDVDKLQASQLARRQAHAGEAALRVLGTNGSGAPDLAALARASYAEAKAEAEDAERRFLRDKQLAKVGGRFVAEEELKASELAWHQARARVAALEKLSEGSPEVVDAKKFKEITEVWGKLPERDRTRALQALTHDLPPNYREAIAAYFRGVATREPRPLNVREEKPEITPAQAEKLRKLAAAWGELPVRDRPKALNDVLGQLPPKYRAAVGAYFRQLEAAHKVAPDKAGAVWHRDASQPSFARVYVGDGNSLDLVSLHVTVTIDGPRARTVVDHVFRNPHNQQLEGTFEYPLPTGASPSYFGMFLGQTRDTLPPRFRPRDDTPLSADALARMTPTELVKHVDTKDWGPLQEGKVVGQDRAREVYEEVTRQRVDPALLEYAGGNTFRGRVFPIPAKGFNRVLIAYEELLPVTQERQVYRFTLPGRDLHEMRFTLQASAAECLQPRCSLPEVKQERGGDGLTYSYTWRDEAPTGQVAFVCLPANPTVHAISGRAADKGPYYLYARVRPEVPVEEAKQPFAKHAVFLLDTSLSEHPDRFGVSMKLLKAILEKDADIESFNVLAFNAGAAWVEPKGWISNTAAEREKLLTRLDGLVLEGATDLSAALEKLVKPGFDVKAGTPLNVFVLSNGHLTWGETDVTALAARFESRCPFDCRFFCYRTGLGAENTELYETLTRKGGGVFQCYGEADVARAARAHRSQCLQVERVRFEGGPAASDVLVGGRRAAVYPGGELVVAGKFAGAGNTRLVVEGKFRGKKVEQTFAVAVGGSSELAPRGWGEVAVESLLALHDPSLDGLVTAYCQQFGIASRLASFLVLESEADYKRFDLAKERGKVSGDLGKFLADAWGLLGKAVPVRQAFERFLARVEPRVKLLSGPEGPRVRKLLGLLKDADFELPVADVPGAILDAKDADAAYLAARKADASSVDVYLTEATRRLAKQDVAGAVRVLSSIVEIHPGRGDALRLVGYRLLDLAQPAQAVRLFQEVQRQRPFEPHSYRDLARSLERCDRYSLAAVQYELVLAGTWHQRFGDALKQVVREEYVHMMQEAINKKAVSGPLAELFGDRIENLAGGQKPSDLRVTITWNTDATDVDLWVIEPDGTKCFYSHNRTKNGGELSADQTQGYGPERYQVAKALPGEYRIVAHYFGANRNLLGGETHVNVVVTRFAGTPRETTERHTVILKTQGQEVEVCRVKF